MQWANSADEKMMMFFFRENRIWQVVQIVSIGDSLHEVSYHIFWKKKIRALYQVLLLCAYRKSFNYLTPIYGYPTIKYVILKCTWVFGAPKNQFMDIQNSTYIYEGESIKNQPNLFLGEIDLFFFDVIAL